MTDPTDTARCTAYIENPFSGGRQNCTRPVGHDSSHASPLIGDAGISGQAGCVYWEDTYIGAVPHAPAAAGVAPAAEAERRDRYAAAMAKRDGDTWPTKYADDEADYRRRAVAAITVSDAEQATLRAERDSLGREADRLRKDWVAMRDRAERAEQAADRVRQLHDRLAEETDLASPDDPIARGAAAQRIADALDGWSPPAAAPAVDRAELESDEERADREETERAHASGDHQYCGPTCEVEFPSDMLRNTILYRAIPGSAGMLDELLRRAAVLPDTSRAAVLREAADAVRDGDLGPRGGMSRDYENGWWNSRAAAEDRVRRLADEAQQPPDTETAAEPPTVRWRLQILDGIWASSGPRYSDRATAVARYRHDSEKGPTWSDPDRTPVQRRIVRETTTYTVERSAAADTGEETERIVGYRSAGGRALRCLQHRPSDDAFTNRDFHPVTSEDLPDGGTCTFPVAVDERCGVDVLIPQEPTP